MASIPVDGFRSAIRHFLRAAAGSYLNDWDIRRSFCLTQVASMNDIHYALRIMRKSPLFTSTVVLTVALAIGTNITMFGVVNAELLRPLPFPDPSRVVQVAEKNDKLHLP